jgi:hypothetical protein
VLAAELRPAPLEMFAWRLMAAAFAQAKVLPSAHPSAQGAIAPDAIPPAVLMAQRLAPPEASAVAALPLAAEHAAVVPQAPQDAVAAVLDAAAAVGVEEALQVAAAAVAVARAGAAEEVLQPAARDAAEVPLRAVLLSAALPLAVAWAFRRDPVLPWPALQPAARSAHAMAKLRSASP